MQATRALTQNSFLAQVASLIHSSGSTLPHPTRTSKPTVTTNDTRKMEASLPCHKECYPTLSILDNQQAPGAAEHTGGLLSSGGKLVD